MPFDVVARVNRMLTDSCQKTGDTGLKFKPYSRTVPGDRIEVRQKEGRGIIKSPQKRVERVASRRKAGPKPTEMMKGKILEKTIKDEQAFIAGRNGNVPPRASTEGRESQGNSIVSSERISRA